MSIYQPWLRSWLTRYGVSDPDIDDIVQDILLCISQEIASFSHAGRRGSFRSWLKSILIHRVRRFWESRRKNVQGTGQTGVLQTLQQLSDPSSSLSRQWDKEHDQQLLQQLLAALRPQFSTTTWRAFELTIFEEMSIQDAADRLGITANAVYIARSRVLRTLRQEGKNLLE